MLDIVMIALLFIGFVSMKLLADWCGKQTEKNNVMYGGITYVVSGSCNHNVNNIFGVCAY